MNDTLRDVLSTPVLTLLRGRIAPVEYPPSPQPRYDIPLLLRESGIPEPAQTLIRHLVRKTRLWRREQHEVASELITHFAGGLDAGQSIDELRSSFGDPKASAKLIRRAKKRNRPLLWQ